MNNWEYYKDSYRNRWVAKHTETGTELSTEKPFSHLVGQVFEEDGDEPSFISKMSEENLAKLYPQRQEAAGFSVGDIVKVTRTAKAREEGWGTEWLSAMNATVGCEGEIMSIRPRSIRIKFESLNLECNYPFFCLEKVSSLELHNRSGIKAGSFVEVLDGVYAKRTGIVQRSKPDNIKVMMNIGTSNRVTRSFTHKQLKLLPSYKQQQDFNCVLKPDDLVQIVRSAEWGECGWGCGWTPEMDQTIGKTGIVAKVHPSHGVFVWLDEDKNDGFWFPYFCLRKTQTSAILGQLAFMCLDEILSGAMFRDEAPTVLSDEDMKDVVEAFDEIATEEEVTDQEEIYSTIVDSDGKVIAVSLEGEGKAWERAAKVTGEFIPQLKSRGCKLVTGTFHQFVK